MTALLTTLSLGNSLGTERSLVERNCPGGGPGITCSEELFCVCQLSSLFSFSFTHLQLPSSMKQHYVTFEEANAD